MRLLVVVGTVVAALLGVVLGYNMAGIGGAIVLAAVIGVGGALFTSLLGRTVMLMRHFWRVTVVTIALVLLAVFTWGVDL